MQNGLLPRPSSEFAINVSSAACNEQWIHSLLTIIEVAGMDDRSADLPVRRVALRPYDLYPLDLESLPKRYAVVEALAHDLQKNVSVSTAWPFNDSGTGGVIAPTATPACHVVERADLAEGISAAISAHLKDALPAVAALEVVLIRQPTLAEELRNDETLLYAGEIVRTRQGALIPQAPYARIALSFA